MQGPTLHYVGAFCATQLVGVRPEGNDRQKMEVLSSQLMKSLSSPKNFIYESYHDHRGP